ncbi:MAG: tetratricopeptide repeat protein [Bryobacteraceae bacterium]|nr:tetratricopeptide repeat protein [Bryobacteraceae bacterium]
MKLLVLLLLAVSAWAGPAEDCWAQRKRGRLAEAGSCFQGLTRSPVPLLRAEGFWGLGRFSDANDQFRVAEKMDPKNAAVKVRWGRMFEERYQPADAAKLFEEALEIRKDYAPALFGMALVASNSFESKAVEFAGKALEADSKLVEAQELLAYLALEDSNPEKAVKEADKAIAMSPEALDAMAVRATIDWLNDQPSSEWIERILKFNPRYGKAYATAGHFFVINRRYEEGIRYYRKALELDPELWEARAELGVNLMRLGEEEEARKHLEIAYNAGYKNAATVNSLRLLDSYKNFKTYKTPTTILRLHKKEDEILAIYFQQELDRAMAAFHKKYRVKLGAPVQVEVYPDHDDFAVRTMGLPGLGALGVTFGYVVAMDSPSGRKPGSFHWASTLWHELSHVYVLAATKHRVPRWFTEGMAVHEETAVSPDWGDRLDPTVIKAIQEKKLLPVADLDRGFIRPSYPNQVVVSYFQAGKICDYIAQKWGYDRLLQMMQDYADRKATPDVIRGRLGMEPAAFDREFLAWLDGQVGASVKGFAEWSKRVRGLSELAKAKKHDEVIREGLAIRDLYPDYVEAGSVYEFLSEAYLAKGDKAGAMRQLADYSKQGGRSPATIQQLADLQIEAGMKKEAAATLERLNYIYPQDPEMHRKLGSLYLEAGNTSGAVREYRALVGMKPLDAAGAHFDLARAYRAARKNEEALEHVLLALEAAPGFKPAQKLLLELNAK